MSLVPDLLYGIGFFMVYCFGNMLPAGDQMRVPKRS